MPNVILLITNITLLTSFAFSQLPNIILYLSLVILLITNMTLLTTFVLLQLVDMILYLSLVALYYRVVIAFPIHS